MPTATIDLILASTAIILIIIGSIYGVNMIVEPYLSDHYNNPERYHQIVRYLLLLPGEPANWGSQGVPTLLGLATEEDSLKIDVDKVTRLNPSNKYALSYPQLWEALGVSDISFRITVDTLFNITLGLESYQSQAGNTTYHFEAYTSSHGYPLTARIKYYSVIGGLIISGVVETDSEGSADIELTLPSSINGTALLIGFAEVEESLLSYTVLPFAHGVAQPDPAGTYASLTPLNYTLEVNLSAEATSLNCTVFSMNYAFNMTEDRDSYPIPRLLDASPMILTLTGVNGSIFWIEWVSYPQIPISTGADMFDITTISDLILVSHLIDVRGVIYRFNALFRSPVDYD